MLPLVTLCGSYNLSSNVVQHCIHSWKNLLNIDGANRYVVPDTNLKTEDVEWFKNMGFTVLDNHFEQAALADYLNIYPCLTTIRERDLTWRKIIDAAFFLRNFEQVVIIDTDVLVNCPSILPESKSDFSYMLEDVPSYRGHWKVAWQQKLVPAFNAGLVIFRPSAVDFDFLEYLTKNYILNCKSYWCSEQLAWSCLAARAERKYIFDGKQVRVVSGFMKRTSQQMLSNKYVHWSKRGIVKNFSQFQPYIDESMILHFAGLGKRWFHQSFEYLSQKNYKHLDPYINVVPDRLLNLKDRLLISAKLLIKESIT